MRKFLIPFLLPLVALAQQSTLIQSRSGSANVALQEAGSTGGYKYLQIVPCSLSQGKPASFGFKTTGDGTNFTVLKSDIGYLETGGQNQIFAPTITYYGTNWIVTYDPQAGTAASAYGLAWSPDLVNWTRVGLQTNGNLLFPGIGFGQQFFTDTSGNTWLIEPFITAGDTHDIVYVSWPTNAFGTAWATNPVAVITNATDCCMIQDSGLYYAFISTPSASGFTICSLTNSTGPTNTFILAKTNLIPGYTMESPQVVKLGPTNWIMYVQAGPNGTNGSFLKTLYSKSTDLYTWSTPVEINENGPIPGRGLLYPLSTSLQLQNVQSLARSNAAVNVRDEIVYYLNTFPGSTTATARSRAIGGGTSGKIKWSVLGYIVNTNTGSEDFAEFELSQSIIEEGVVQPGTIYPVGPPVFSSIHRPSSAFRADVIFVSADAGLSVSGWDEGPFLKLTGSSTTFVRWRVREWLEAENGFIGMSPFPAGILGWSGTVLANDGPPMDGSNITNRWRKETIYFSGWTNAEVQPGNTTWWCPINTKAGITVVTNSVIAEMPRYGYYTNLRFGISASIPSTTNLVFGLATNVWAAAGGNYPGLVTAGLTGTLRGSATTPTVTNVASIADFWSDKEVGAFFVTVATGTTLKTATNWFGSIEHFFQDN